MPKRKKSSTSSLPGLKRPGDPLGIFIFVGILPIFILIISFSLEYILRKNLYLAKYARSPNYFNQLGTFHFFSIPKNNKP